MGTSWDRRINLYINGQQISNDVKSIRAEMTKLVNEQARMTIGSQEYIAHASKIRQLKSILAEHNQQISAIGNSWSFKGMAESINKYFGLITAGIASVTGVIMGWKQLVKTFNDFEERVDNLSALTGLSGDALDWLSKKAKEMSVGMLENGIRVTQSAQEIVDAFTKVGSARPELLSNKEALVEVTQNAIILANAAKTELQPAIEALTMVMNQYNVPASEARRIVNALGAGSKAGAGEIPYLTAAFEKAGTVAADANIPIETLIATIETLAPRISQPEIAGRTLKSVLIDLQKGADDTNPALVGMATAFENLGKKNLTVTQLTALFGVENITTAKILINNIGELKKYETAVTGTNVAIEQAVINTDNNNAKLAQARNRINIVSIELGEKLAPSLTLVTGWFGKSLSMLLALINMFTKYGGVIITSTAAIIGYTGAIKVMELWTARNNATSIIAISLAKLRVIWLNTERAAVMLFVAAQALLAGNIQRAAQAMRIFNAVVKLSPIGLLVGALMAIGTALIFYNRELSATEKVQKMVDDIHLQAQQSIVGEKTALEQLLIVARNEANSKRVRQAAMEQINAISPEFLGNINLESVNTKSAATAIDQYIGSLERKAKAQAAFEKLKDIESERLSLEAGIGGEPGIGTKVWHAVSRPFIASRLNSQTAGENRQKRLEELKLQKKSLQEFIDDGSTPSSSGSVGGTGGKAQATTDLIKIQEQLLEANNRLSGGTEVELADRQRKAEAIEKEIRRLKELGTTKEGEADKAELRKKKKGAKLDDKDKMESADAANKAEIDNINKRHLEGLTNEDQYNAELLGQESAFLRKKMEIFKEGSKEYEDAAAALSMNEVKLKKHADDLILKAEQQLADAKIENIQDGFDKEMAIERANYEEKLALLRKQLVDKTELSDEEKKLNDLTNATIEEQTRAHLQRMADLELGKQIEKQMSEATYQLASATTNEEMYAAKREIAQAEYQEEFAAAKDNAGKMAMAEKNLSDKILAIKTEEKEARLSIGLAIADAAYNAFSQLVEIVGKETALGKALFLFQQASAVAQIIFNTAIANAQAVATFWMTGGQPWVTINTIAAVVSIGSVLAQTIKGFSAGGYTGDGSINDPAGTVHKGEYVIPQEGVTNPRLKNLIGTIENARKNRSLSTLDLNPMITGSLVNNSNGLAGNITSAGSASGSDLIITHLANQLLTLNETMNRINANQVKLTEQLKKPISVNKFGHNGIAEAMDDITRYNRLTK